MRKFDIRCEKWREYEFAGRQGPYRIEDPQDLYLRDGGRTHRVVDADGVVHCVPAPGEFGCILRWKSRRRSRPVAF